jgi:hypothetical protein
VNAGCGEELVVFKPKGTEGFHVFLEPCDEAFYLRSGGVGGVAFQKPSIELYVIGKGDFGVAIVYIGEVKPSCGMC